MYVAAYTGEVSEQQLVDRAVRACREAAARLALAGVPPEALAEFVPAGRRFGVLPRAATMRPLGEVWRLGALLLDADGGLFAAGRATRAQERGRPGYQSASREARRDIAAAALHGGYPAGTPVNFDARPLPLAELARRHDSAQAAPVTEEELPLGVHEGEFRVRWRAGASIAGAQTLDAYLAERVDLLIHPPFAAD